MNSETIYVYVFCEGRLANQLLAWANGRCVTRNLPNRKLVLNYPPLIGKCSMPKTVFVQNKGIVLDVCGNWPKATTAELPGMNRSCFWTEAWINRPPPAAILEALNEVRFSSRIWDEASALTRGRKFIGVHIRYGDYEAVDDENQTAPKPVFPRASNQYYTEALDRCLAMLPGSSVFLCTDGEDAEVAWFTERYHPALQPKNDGLLDLLTLSKCDIIIASASTFSPLAATLGGKPYIYPGTSPERITEIIASVASKP